MKPIISILILILLSANTLFAQDTHFSQFYSSSVYLNPALAGIEEESKMVLLHRDQWPGLKNSFVSQNFSFEGRSEELNSGFGINAYSDKAGEGQMTTMAFSGVYAYEIKINKDLYIRSGMKAGVVQKYIDWNSLVFEDMIDSRGGVVSATQQKETQDLIYLDLSAGIMIYGPRYYGGFSVDHLNGAKEGLINESSLMQRRLTIHGGARFELPHSSDYAISPNILYSKQGEFTKLNVGMYVEANVISLGLWYGSQQTMIMSLGIHIKRSQIAYSYDLTSSAMTGTSMGSHEISFIQRFKAAKPRKRRYKTTPCPKF